jgi:4-hydroxybenzoate polyprenyltransferase
MKLQHVLAAIPFVGVLVGMFFANSVEPYVLGLPFAMFWVVLWVVLAAIIMAVVYRLDEREEQRER